jgi:CRP/FNR family cyclic AMP-dependent transcriptional regulator
MPPVSVGMLREVPLFSGLDEPELEQIADAMHERRFAAGATVVQEGASAFGLFIIEEGEADVVTAEGELRGRLGPGDFFGEIALLANSPRTATIIAASDLLCYSIAAWDLRPLLDTNETIAGKLMTAMAERNLTA